MTLIEMLVGVASLIPALQNIGILHHKKAKLPKHLQHSVLHIMKSVDVSSMLKSKKTTTTKIEESNLANFGHRLSKPAIVVNMK